MRAESNSDKRASVCIFCMPEVAETANSGYVLIMLSLTRTIDGCSFTLHGLMMDSSFELWSVEYLSVPGCSKPVAVQACDLDIAWRQDQEIWASDQVRLSDLSKLAPILDASNGTDLSSVSKLESIELICMLHLLSSRKTIWRAYVLELSQESLAA